MDTQTLEADRPAATLVAVDGRTYPLESARILARADGGIAVSTLVQSYANPHDEPLEVIYTLPLPADGAVLGYTIRIGEKVIRAEVQPREKAAKAYRDALFEGRTAGLLEQTRTDTFQQKLGNVPAKAKVEITIDVLHPLAFLATDDPGAVFRWTGGCGTGRELMPNPVRLAASPQWEYRFPTVVGVRYHGAPGRTPDQAELSPDREVAGGIPTRVELVLTIGDPGGAIVHSPSHGVRVEAGEGGSVVTFHEGERLDRDVVVRWEAASEAVGARLVEGRGLPGDDGRYALVTVVPPRVPQSTFGRDLTVLIDASGSMTGTPLELAQRVVGELLRSLGEEDRFELLAFSNDTRRLTGRMNRASGQNLRKALEALDRLHAGGGTEMAGAVAEAMRPLRGEAQRQVVLVTDGQISFEAEVVGEITARENVRLHVVGVGSVPNRALTQQAAAAGRGVEVLAGDRATADEAARRLVTATASPVLTNVTVGGTALTGVKPERLHDVFAGMPLVLSVELSPQGGTLDVRGDLMGARGPWVQAIDVPQAGAAGALASTAIPVGALHGRAAIARLEIDRAGGRRQSPAEIDARIESLGMRHRIASRCTSLVAISEEPSVDPLAPRVRRRLAVELPAGVSAAAAGLERVGDAGLPAVMKSMRRMAARPAGPARAMPGPDRFESERTMMQECTIQARRVFDTPPRPEISVRVDQVRWLEPDLIVIEFEVPVEGFELRPDPVDLTWSGPGLQRIEAVGTIDLTASSGLGPHAMGRIVRLAIRLAAPGTWLAGKKITLECAAHATASGGAPGRCLVRASFQVPTAPEHPGPGEGR